MVCRRSSELVEIRNLFHILFGLGEYIPCNSLHIVQSMHNCKSYNPLNGLHIAQRVGCGMNSWRREGSHWLQAI